MYLSVFVNFWIGRELSNAGELTITQTGNPHHSNHNKCENL